MGKKDEPKYMEHKREYINDYNKSNYKQIRIRIRYDDLIVLDRLNQVKSVNAYILDLIREDAVKSLKV